MQNVKAKTFAVMVGDAECQLNRRWVTTGQVFLAITKPTLRFEWSRVFHYHDRRAPIVLRAVAENLILVRINKKNQYEYTITV